LSVLPALCIRKAILSYDDVVSPILDVVHVPLPVPSLDEVVQSVIDRLHMNVGVTNTIDTKSAPNVFSTPNTVNVFNSVPDTLITLDTTITHVSTMVPASNPSSTIETTPVGKSKRIGRGRGKKSPALPGKGCHIEVKFSEVGWCTGIVKRLYGDTAKIYFNCDHTEPTLNLKKVKWRWT